MCIAKSAQRMPAIGLDLIRVYSHKVKDIRLGQTTGCAEKEKRTDARIRLK